MNTPDLTKELKELLMLDNWSEFAALSIAERLAPEIEKMIPRWIPVGDELPEDNETAMWCTVPVCDPYVVTCMCSDDWRDYFTHWMRLPKGPME